MNTPDPRNVPDPHAHPGTDPEPARTPDLEPGGGVAPGSTPPDSGSTSGLSAPEPRTRNRFPPTGILTIGAIVLIVVLFLVVIVGILM
ncbi:MULTISPECIES: DUF6480 family protein [Rhodococcus]|jgi:hypothetical protein|uniref:DUF6480 family protein n=1 Tax=Rhodococcus TaxID=1827 RepID=UPI00081AA9DE|nr:MULTISPECIES: DUF6480 family protein [Rhodococcus]NCL73382.1 hypothetical protein [Rhodococcus sp. YH1]ANZ27986.1 hypothetical protein A4U64_05005 [Rhodococcus sp. WB1]MBC2588805.1 hypothetical protein [Rhodococcus aetherivorans]MDV6293660.1 DUF6480 family protein [Rhodococcus aetherivorans]QRI78188.1 hypothetical protein JQ505_10940 [Rhodococcus aetherivorans]